MAKNRFAYCGARSALLMAVLLAAATAANAQPAIPGVSVVPPPPPGFDALAASPQARASYAIPPAPDPVAAPDAYRFWQRAVSGPQHWVTPALEQTEIYHGPPQNLAPAGTAESEENTIENGIASLTNLNWSGSAVVDPNASFKGEAIMGVFVVPTAHQAFGSCTGSWDYASLWVGIDGVIANHGSFDILQAGVDSDALCSGGTTKYNIPSYYAWVEWAPNAATRVSIPAIHPGDEVLVEVWENSPTSGSAHFYNYSTQQGAVYALTAPSGTSLAGTSVEWIVERPNVGGSLATLTNYIDASWQLGHAWNPAGQPTYPGSNPPTGTLYEITMLDNGGSGISSATAENSQFLFFQDFGSACGRGSAFPPC